jgi:hypothetical protein
VGSGPGPGEDEPAATNAKAAVRRRSRWSTPEVRGEFTRTGGRGRVGPGGRLRKGAETGGRGAAFATIAFVDSEDIPRSRDASVESVWTWQSNLFVIARAHSLLILPGKLPWRRRRC